MSYWLLSATLTDAYSALTEGDFVWILVGGVAAFAGAAFEYFGVQLPGVVTVAAWVAVLIGIIFFAMKKTGFLRASAADEMAGLDISEHGLASSYADFMPTPSVLLNKDETPELQAEYTYYTYYTYY